MSLYEIISKYIACGQRLEATYQKVKSARDELESQEREFEKFGKEAFDNIFGKGLLSNRALVKVEGQNYFVSGSGGRLHVEKVDVIEEVKGGREFI